jgi:hypothetical protein
VLQVYCCATSCCVAVPLISGCCKHTALLPQQEHALHKTTLGKYTVRGMRGAQETVPWHVSPHALRQLPQPMPGCRVKLPPSCPIPRESACPSHLLIACGSEAVHLLPHLSNCHAVLPATQLCCETGQEGSRQRKEAQVSGWFGHRCRVQGGEGTAVGSRTGTDRQAGTACIRHNLTN